MLSVIAPPPSRAHHYPMFPSSTSFMLPFQRSSSSSSSSSFCADNLYMSTLPRHLTPTDLFSTSAAISCNDNNNNNNNCKTWVPCCQSPVKPVKQQKQQVKRAQGKARLQDMTVEEKSSLTITERMAKLLKEGDKDFSNTLFVDCSIEYDLPNAAKIPKNSEPILQIYPGYGQRKQSCADKNCNCPEAVRSRQLQLQRQQHQAVKRTYQGAAIGQQQPQSYKGTFASNNQDMFLQPPSAKRSRRIPQDQPKLLPPFPYHWQNYNQPYWANMPQQQPQQQPCDYFNCSMIQQQAVAFQQKQAAAFQQKQVADLYHKQAAAAMKHKFELALKQKQAELVRQKHFELTRQLVAARQPSVCIACVNGQCAGEPVWNKENLGIMRSL